jgi:hypothetical protein
MAPGGDYTFRQDASLAGLEHLFRNASGNLTAIRTTLAPAWVSGPELRGTISILWSCIITLIACIFTALHLNVPVNTKKLPMLREKFKWVMIGLIAPEVVLYLASSQFLDSRRLSRELSSLWQQRELGDSVPKLENEESPLIQVS